MTEELTCKELVELVTAYLEDELDGAERTRFEEHIADCDGCSAYLEQMRATIRAAGRVREADISPEAREALLRTFRSWKAARA